MRTHSTHTHTQWNRTQVKLIVVDEMAVYFVGYTLMSLSSVLVQSDKLLRRALLFVIVVAIHDCRFSSFSSSGGNEANVVRFDDGTHGLYHSCSQTDAVHPGSHTQHKSPAIVVINKDRWFRPVRSFHHGSRWCLGG